jgi:uncharacterized membrane protein YhaH (DUF805 family)
MFLLRFFTLSGRIGRGSYWLTIGVSLAVWFFCTTILLQTTFFMDRMSVGFANGVQYAAIAILLSLLWVTVARDVKRWHDRGKRGAWVLIVLIPVIGQLWSLIELGFLSGDSGPNRFGPPESGSPFRSAANVSYQPAVPPPPSGSRF